MKKPRPTTGNAAARKPSFSAGAHVAPGPAPEGNGPLDSFSGQAQTLPALSSKRKGTCFDEGQTPALALASPMLIPNQRMGNRTRKDDLAAPIMQLAALLVLGGILLPQVRQFLKGLGLSILIVLALAAVAFMLWRLLNRNQQQAPVRLNSAVPSMISPVTRGPAGQARTGKLDCVTPATTTDLVQSLRAIDWFQFEKLVAATYSKLGYAVTRKGGANPDGGVDLVIERDGVRLAIQCKQWKAWRVGVKGIRELLGALTHTGINRGIFITLRGYTKEAKMLANQHNIEILDETGLTRLLNEASALKDSALLEMLHDRRKFCPKCESEMVLRTARKGSKAGNQFWGCSRYPRCHYVMEADI